MLELAAKDIDSAKLLFLYRTTTVGMNGLLHARALSADRLEQVPVPRRALRLLLTHEHLSP